LSYPKALTAVRATKVRPDHHVEVPEHVATEEPMEIRAAGPQQQPVPVAVTMRTPGHDFELAVGFLVTERLASPSEITGVGYCDAVNEGPNDGSNGEATRYNTVTVALAHAWSPDRPSRQFAASASCGVCGKASIDQVELGCAAVPPAEPVAASLIPLLPNRLRSGQRVFDRTGGLHAAGLFDALGTLHCVREDVGRHNAVDKIAGHLALGDAARQRSAPAGSGLPCLAGWVLMVSGRVSFEIVQKAAGCGIGTIAAVSAPSSLAVAAAERLGITLAGFVRDGQYNVYSHPERLDFDH
jgi:FdhD protein